MHVEIALMVKHKIQIPLADVLKSVSFKADAQLDFRILHQEEEY